MTESLGESPDTFQRLEDTFGVENTPKFRELVRLLTEEKGLSEDAVMGILDEVEGGEEFEDFVWSFMFDGVFAEVIDAGEDPDPTALEELFNRAGF